MRLQYKFVTSHFDDDASAPHSVQRHYSVLMEELRRQSPHQSILQRSTHWRPPADLHETAETILVKLELAGVREEDLTITLYEDALVVTGRRDDDLDATAAVCYHEAQIRYGPFRAEIMLPAPVRREGVEATYANGLLRVRLPKAAGSTRDALPTRPRLVERATKATHPLQAAHLPTGTDAAEPAEAVTAAQRKAARQNGVGVPER